MSPSPADARGRVSLSRLRERVGERAGLARAEVTRAPPIRGYASSASRRLRRAARLRGVAEQRFSEVTRAPRLARPALSLTLPRRRGRGPERHVSLPGRCARTCLPLPSAGEGRGEGRPCESRGHASPADPRLREQRLSEVTPSSAAPRCRRAALLGGYASPAARKACPLPNPPPQTGEGTGKTCLPPRQMGEDMSPSPVCGRGSGRGPALREPRSREPRRSEVTRAAPLGGYAEQRGSEVSPSSASRRLREPRGSQGLPSP